MTKFTFILIGTVGVLSVVCSATNNENITIEQIYNMANNIVNATNQWQKDINNYSVDGRKSKLLPFGLLPFHALWGFGGLHALGILFAIKFKIIIIASIVALSVYYYTKVYAKKCKESIHDPFYREGAVYPMESSHNPSYISSPLTPYSSHVVSDIPGYSAYPSYPSVEPYSGYHDIHSDISPATYDSDHHHYHDFGHYHDTGHFHGDHSAPDHHAHEHTFSAPPESPPNPQDDSKDAQDAAGPTTYRRVSRHRRRRSTRPQIEFIDIGELAFRFLGVDTEGCRRRFVCELDFRAKANPITRLAFSFIGRNFFERYRTLDEGAPQPQRFTDCGKVYKGCKDAERYDNIEEEEEVEEVKEEVKEEKPNTDESELEGAGDSAEEPTTTTIPEVNDADNVVRRKRFNDFFGL